MTNRERLLKENIYDTLVRFNKNCAVWNICVFDVMGEVPIRCRKIPYRNGDFTRAAAPNVCDECIAEWMNKEAK